MSAFTPAEIRCLASDVDWADWPPSAPPAEEGR